MIMNESPSTANEKSPASSSAIKGRKLTVPNALCVARLIGSLMMIPLAFNEEPTAVIILFMALTVTDWLDGKLARWLDQRSSIGPRLDSIADATMYAMLLFAAIWMRGDVIAQEYLFVLAVVSTYLVSAVFSLTKFGQLPSYHTLSAKASWLLMVTAVIALFLDWSVWPVRLALIGVSVANLESILITAILDESKTDVRSFMAAKRMTTDPPSE